MPQTHVEDVAVDLGIGVDHAPHSALYREPEPEDRASHRSSNIYFRNLVGKGRGSPLWLPEPSYNMPIEYQREGVSIGDVGVLLASGSFNFFFNIFLPSNHPFNQGNTPEGFVPLTPPLSPVDVQRLREFTFGSYITSESIKISHRQYSDSPMTDLDFESTAKEGAILTLPHGANSEDVVNTIRLRSYISRHIESWYRYIIGVRGCEVRNGDVRVVIGCDKTDSWGMAAFVRSAETVRLRFQPIGQGETYRWEYSGSFDTRTGPDLDILRRLQRTGDGTPICNQCVFARTLNANLRKDIWERIAQEVYLELGIDLTGGFDDKDDHSVVLHSIGSDERTNSDEHSWGIMRTNTSRQASNVSINMMRHPSNRINDLLWDYIHSNLGLLPEDINAVVTEDRDWISVMRPDDTSLPSPDVLYNRIMSEEPELMVDGEADATKFISIHLKPSSSGSKHTYPSTTTITAPLARDERRGSGISTSPNAAGEDFGASATLLEAATWGDLVTEGWHGSDRAGPVDRKMLSRSSSRQSLHDRTNVDIFPSRDEDMHRSQTPSLPGPSGMTETTKQRLIAAEQQRRDELRDGYACLRHVLPFSNLRDSRLRLLERATRRIQHLQQENNDLKLRLAEVEEEYRRVHTNLV
ncbi:hypothetical protein D9613_012769 [Agrocybe pediades]|uniref:BHLH domain-containing protein n=1 Tax=Agrocybe pediades TaxID=84607 RepID=A0A8H4QK29_9AGAR|nr:hypothetical protein D9613_012769 [Agrocybe pediades]